MKVNSFTSGSVALENLNLKEVNAGMTEDVVSWLKDTGQETIQNIIIGTIIMMHRLPFTVSLNTTWGKWYHFLVRVYQLIMMLTIKHCKSVFEQKKGENDITRFSLFMLS